MVIIAQRKGAASHEPTISMRNVAFIEVWLASAAPRNEPTTQFDKLTGRRKIVNKIKSATETMTPARTAELDIFVETSFPIIELDIFPPRIKRPVKTPAIVSTSAIL